MGEGIPRPDKGMIEGWADVALGWASEILDRNPPDAGDEGARRGALLAIDDVLHITTASELDAVRSFYVDRISRAIGGIRSSPCSPARLWRMYNHGFVLKTEGGTVAFDLIRGYGRTSVDDSLARSLADGIDVAMVSHRHRDHADLELCRLVSGAGGRILVPPDLHELWAGEEGLDLVKLGPEETYDLGSLHFTALEGHHDGPPDRCDCNIYHLRVEGGHSAMHTGDHWINRRMPLLPEDESILEEWGRRFPVDLLLVNRSPYHFSTIIDRIRPRLAVSSHENELSHDIAARATYASSMNQMASIDVPCHTMAWGEVLAIPPQKAPAERVIE